MGILEESSKRKAQHGEVQKLILETVKFAGLLSVSLVAQNVIGAMGKLDIISTKRQSEVVNSSPSTLAKKGLLKFNGKFYELTAEGEKKLRELELRGYRLKRPKRWDRKWRVIIFDIPEKKRKARDR